MNDLKVVKLLKCSFLAGILFHGLVIRSAKKCLRESTRLVLIRFRHYHSMQMFARYDLLDSLGNRVADGHKASFCLEDVECMPRAVQKFVCRGLGDQG